MKIFLLCIFVNISYQARVLNIKEPNDIEDDEFNR